jgi:hypothetical protein
MLGVSRMFTFYRDDEVTIVLPRPTRGAGH